MVLLHCKAFFKRFGPSCWALQIYLVQRSQTGLDRGQIGLFPQGTQIAEEMASPAYLLHKLLTASCRAGQDSGGSQSKITSRWPVWW